MNKKYYILPAVAFGLCLSSCDDQVMEWKDSDSTVSSSELPLQVAEQLALYKPIKEYAAKYRPNVEITNGVSLDLFLNNDAYRAVVLENFAGVTFGNAMKHQSIVSASGATNWSAVDQFFAMNTGLKLHGHNLLWHTQQQQTYMKSLIAPKLVQEESGGGDGISNVLVGDASDFEGGTTGGWGSWGSNKKDAGAKEGAGKDGSFGLVLENNGDGNAWEAQCAYTFDTPLKKGVPYIIQFDAKSSSAAGQLQFQYQNGTTYGSQGGYNTFNLGTDWMRCEYEFTIADYDDVNRIILNFGAVGATYYVDNIKFGEKNPEASSAPARAASYHYELKTPEEKRAILLEYMEAWIKESMEHCGQYCSSWDVINEPIDDNCRWRGFDGAFMTNGEDEEPDREPVETTEAGLDLGWLNGAGNGHWYWGYFIGKDYAAKAFEFAAKYNPNGAKLFVNDYNLETNPSKLAELVKFVEYIDANGGHVDGIGTQMHVSKSITKEQVDAMFKTLAATGKLVRVTELDVALGTSTPSAGELQTQSDVYKMILTSFFENVPEAQQSGITIWGLSDKANEHEYWLNGDAPNLFDADYARKTAYKGVCDAIAGFDLSTEFSGDDWKDVAPAPEE